MKTNQVIKLMNYSSLQNEWKWILSVVIIGSGLLLLWIGYKVVLFKLNWGDGRDRFRKIRNDMAWVVDEELVIPFSGKLIPIAQVPDPIFSEKMVGDGFAIDPTEGEILCPVSGKVTQIYSNGDAITLKSAGGRNLILHIGINTMNLKGQGIKFDINEGDIVQAGEKIGNIDLEYVIPKITSVISPIVFPDLKETERVVLRRDGMVKAGEKGIIAIEREKEEKER